MALTQININEPERFSYWRTLEEMNAKLDAELKLWKSRCDAAEDQLEAIFENIREGRECYLDYRDKTRIWIIRDPKQDQS